MGLRLEWINELDDYEIPERWIELLQRLLQTAGQSEGVEHGEVALTFVDNETIRSLNRDYRGLDRATDVLSFALQEVGIGESEIFFDEADEAMEFQDELLGDIVISVPQAIAQSEEYGHSLEREIGFLFVHGFLHLIGYDHQDEASEKEMFGKQEIILREVGLTR
ncbi:rRNA maturation RNase YbeY [Ferviditalea candida]|uniref:Endoribonuclease YbeY n=1 Tax=Ferviditalea candida TaxID=3108399 RepID=A0ABU5ZDY4_9BACL|nr:rRNA maturation RNase YbeY [Paenibacillaceae bacterium T2]